MSDVILFRATGAAEMESPYALHNRAQIAFAAAPPVHGCIPRGHRRVLVIDQRWRDFPFRPSAASSAAPASATAPAIARCDLQDPRPVSRPRCLAPARG